MSDRRREHIIGTILRMIMADNAGPGGSIAVSSRRSKIDFTHRTLNLRDGLGLMDPPKKGGAGITDYGRAYSKVF